MPEPEELARQENAPLLENCSWEVQDESSVNLHSHRIDAEVEHRLSVVDELETVVSANLQRAIRLRQSILQRALCGGLSQ